MVSGIVECCYMLLIFVNLLIIKNGLDVLFLLIDLELQIIMCVDFGVGGDQIVIIVVVCKLFDILCVMFDGQVMLLFVDKCFIV